MYTLKVDNIDKTYFQSQKGDVLELTATILDDDGAEVEQRRLSFDLSIDQEELESELQKFINNYNQEMKIKQENVERDAVYAKADETIKNLTGLELSADNE